jgi:hypothetical protein
MARNWCHDPTNNEDHKCGDVNSFQNVHAAGRGGRCKAVKNWMRWWAQCRELRRLTGVATPFSDL